MTLASTPRMHALSPAALSRLRSDLAALTEERTQLALIAADPEAGGDIADQALLAERDMGLEQLDERIARVRDRIAEAELSILAGHAVRSEPVPADTAVDGSRVQLRFAAGEQPEDYLLADIEERGGLPVVTPDSPLGRALLGARAGSTVTYRSPRGERSVELVGVSSAFPDVASAA